MQRKQTKIYQLFSKVKFCNRTLSSGRMPRQMHQQVFSVFQLHLLKVLKVLGCFTFYFLACYKISLLCLLCNWCKHSRGGEKGIFNGDK